MSGNSISFDPRRVSVNRFPKKRRLRKSRPSLKSYNIILSMVLLLANAVCAFVELLIPTRLNFIGRRLVIMNSFWSRTAELGTDAEAYQGVKLQTCETIRPKNEHRAYDLSSPREWMEYLQQKDGDANATEGGAYTVIRCEYTVSSNKTGKWNICGEAFHLGRLCFSYQTLLEESTLKEQPGNTAWLVHKDVLDQAKKSSQKIVGSLLAEAESALSSRVTVAAESIGENTTFVVMVTLLWERSRNSYSVVVRGHACTSGDEVCVSKYNPAPVAACLAVHPNPVTSLPNRHKHYPRAKLSSWCRRRRPLETTFKSSGVGEVLLVRQREQAERTRDFEILEGLTSNFFAVYKDGTLRTAPEGVLEGYARGLVIACANRCGIRVEHAPITIDDAMHWEETFLTSSMKLIVPIGKIVFPNNLPEKRMNFQEVWSSNTERIASPKWRMLYEEMLKLERTDM